MTTAAPGRLAVLVAGAVDAWEAEALDRIRSAGPGLVLLKRCLDLSDLLASAAVGTAGVALVSARLPGLDADAVSRLRRAGLGVLLVTEPGAGTDPAEVAGWARRLGVDHVIGAGGFADLAERLVAAALQETSRRVPAAEPMAAAGAGAGPGGMAGRVIAVWGPTGAPGRTTVSAGIAAELAARGRSTLLIDADPYGGAAAQQLAVVEEVSGLLAATRLANAGQLDAARLAALARQVGEHLRLLTGLPRPDRWQEVRPAAFEELLRQAVRLTSYVVVDTGLGLEGEPMDPFVPAAPSRNDMTLSALREADEVVAVGSADPVGLSRLVRGLVDLAEVRPQGPGHVVVNRMRNSLGWSEREVVAMVERVTPRAGVHFLPEDRNAVDRALVAGRTLVEAGDSALRRALAELVTSLAGPPARRPRRGRRRRVRGPGRPAQALSSR